MESNLPPTTSTPRKVKFAPKGPPRRKPKPLQPKPISFGKIAGGEDDDETNNQALLRKVNDHLTRRRPQAEKKSSGQVAFSHGVASSTNLRTYGIAKEGSGDRSDSIGSGVSASDTKPGILCLPSTTRTDGIVKSSENATEPLFKLKKTEYKEPWDYHHSYYPVTLPFRRPYSGDPEVLDREEFGEAKAVSEYDESAVRSASDLGLLEEDDGVKMLFLQLPATLPFGKQPAITDSREASGFSKLQGVGHASARANGKKGAGHSAPGDSVASAMAKGKEIHGSFSLVSGNAKGKEIVGNSMSSMGTNISKKVCTLEELPAGYMGKMLVYKSGAVKLTLGDIMYDVSPGSDCKFAQDIVAINTKDTDCYHLGEPSKRAVVTPDINSLLDPVIHLT